MPPRRGTGVGRAGIGQGRPIANAVLLEEIWHLRTRMTTMETTQRRARDDGIASANEEETTEEEVEEESKATKVMKMLEKASSRPMVEVPLYDGNLTVEVLMDWISSFDKYFDYEEVVDKKKVNFAATRLKGHAALWWDEL